MVLKGIRNLLGGGRTPEAVEKKTYEKCPDLKAFDEAVLKMFGDRSSYGRPNSFTNFVNTVIRTEEVGRWKEDDDHHIRDENQWLWNQNGDWIKAYGELGTEIDRLRDQLAFLKNEQCIRTYPLFGDPRRFVH